MQRADLQIPLFAAPRRPDLALLRELADQAIAAQRLVLRDKPETDAAFTELCLRTIGGAASANLKACLGRPPVTVEQQLLHAAGAAIAALELWRRRHPEPGD